MKAPCIRLLIGLLAFPFFILGAATACAQQARYEVITLPFEPIDMNDEGGVVGWNAAGEGIIWIDGKVVNLGLGVYPLGINNAGQVSGSKQDYDDPSFLWQDGMLVDLPSFPNMVAKAQGINNNGQIIGQAISTELNNNTRWAVMWQNGQIENISPYDHNDAFALYINDNGQVLVDSYISTSNRIGGYYLLSGSTAVFTDGLSAFGLTDDGRVLLTLLVDNRITPFVWSPDGLEQVPMVSPQGISPTGETIVGADSGRASMLHNGILADLNELIDPDSGWILNRAWIINRRGQIAGSGTLDGQLRYFLLTPIATQCPVYDPEVAAGYRYVPRAIARSTSCALKWNSSAGGAFGDAANWQDGDPSTTGCDVTFDTGSAVDYTVTFSDDYDARTLVVGRDLVRFGLAGHGFSSYDQQADSGEFTSPAGTSLRIGNVPGHSGSLMVTNGRLATGEGFAVVGDLGGHGSLIVSSGGVFEVPNETGCVAELVIGSGSGSQGSLLVEQGGKVAASWMTTAGKDVNSVGDLLIQGAGSRWHGRIANVGLAGSGRLVVRDAGEAESVFLHVGVQVDASGEILVTGPGSRLSLPEGSIFHVGRFGQGSVEVLDGGQIVKDGAIEEAHTMLVATKTGSTGVILIEGAGSEWKTGYSILGLGGEGTASLRIREGAEAIFGSFEAATGTSGSGLIEITGLGSRLDLVHPDGQSVLARAGSGTTRLVDGGVLTVAANIVIGGDPGERSPGTGLLEVNGRGSQVKVDAGLALGDRSSGTVVVSAGGGLSAEEVWVGFVDRVPRLYSYLTVTGSASTATADRLIVGGGTGVAAIADGAQMEVGDVVIGRDKGSDGDLVVDGSGSSLFARQIVVADEGVGSLRVTNDGYVRTELLRIGSGGIVDSTGGRVEAEEIDVGMSLAKRHGARSAGRVSAPSIQTDTLWIGAGAVLEVERIAVHPSGTLGGSGGLSLDLTNAGTLAPGDSTGSIGALTLAANYYQTEIGIIDIELGGPEAYQYDMLMVGATAHLGGTLRLSLVDDYIPVVGEQFTVLTAGALSGVFDAIDAVHGLGVSVTYGPESVTVTAVEVTVSNEPDSGGSLAAFALHAPYPNPFHPQTNLQYDVPESADVRLAVYDLVGREVAVLAEGPHPPGRHEVVLDGHALASGTYAVRLTASGFTSSRLVSLVK